MILKVIGICCIMLGCGGYGFYLAYSYRMQIKILQQLIAAFDHMECELVYRQTPLADMLRKASTYVTGRVRSSFIALADELDRQTAPDVATCMAITLRRVGEIPAYAYDVLVQLGRSLGMFDVEGQLKGLRAVRRDCECSLRNCTNNQDARIHTYQTLGVCAGAAIVILFI